MFKLAKAMWIRLLNNPFLIVLHKSIPAGVRFFTAATAFAAGVRAGMNDKRLPAVCRLHSRKSGVSVNFNRVCNMEATKEQLLVRLFGTGLLLKGALLLRK